MRTSRLLAALITCCFVCTALAQQPEPLQTIKAPGASLAVSSDGKLAIGGGEKAPLNLVDYKGLDELITLENQGGSYLSVDLAGDGSLLAAIRVTFEPHENSLAVWDTISKKRLWETTEGVSWARVTPDGSMVAAGRHGSVRFYDARLGSVIRDLPAHDGSNVILGEYSRGGNLLVTADDDQRINLWVVERAQSKGLLPFEGDDISGLAVSDDGNLIAVAQSDKITVFDVKAAEMKWTRVAAKAPIRGLDFRPKSIQLAAGSVDGAARIFSGVTGDQLELIEPGTGAVEAVRYSADGLVLFVGTPAATLKYSAKPRSEPDEVRAEPGQ